MYFVPRLWGFVSRELLFRLSRFRELHCLGSVFFFLLFFGTVFSCPKVFSLVGFIMVSHVLIGDNNLAKFWPAYQFGRAGLKNSLMLTATDLDTLDLALTQVEEKDVVILSVLTSILLEEINHLELDSSAYNVCDQVVSRISGLCPGSPSCQVFSLCFLFWFVPPFPFAFSLCLYPVSALLLIWVFVCFFFEVLSCAAGEVRAALLVRWVILDHQLCSDQVCSQVPFKPSPVASIPDRLHDVWVGFVLFVCFNLV